MYASKTLIGLHSDQSFQHSFEATTGTCAAACRNQVTVGVEDFNRNCVGEFVRAATELDGTREPVCLYPGSGGAKNEGLGHCAVRVAVCVPPDTQVGNTRIRGKRATIARRALVTLSI